MDNLHRHLAKWNSDMTRRNSILIADSCHLMRWSLVQTLGNQYQVDEVKTGEEALAALGSRRYEVVILGCGCSDLTCRELTRRSKLLQPELQIVLLGNLPAEHSDCGCHPIETPCFYEKPLDLSDLRGRIETMMSAVNTQSARPAVADEGARASTQEPWPPAGPTRCCRGEIKDS